MNRTVGFFIGLAVTAAMMLSGCGGSSSAAPGGAVNGLTKAQVLDALGQGAAVQSASGSARRARSAEAVRPLTPDPKIFDEYLQVWSVNAFTGTDFRTNFFVDEALTVPAGFSLFSNDVTNGVIRQMETRVTAGPRAGFVMISVARLAANNLSLTLENNTTDPIDGNSSMTGEFDLATGGGRFTSTSTTNGVTVTAAVMYSSEGTFTQTLTSSNGVTVTFNGAVDGTVTGTVTGQGEGLPATFTWDNNGVGTITWADGTTQPLDLEVLRSRIYGG